MRNPFIINTAFTGAVADHKLNSNVPITVSSIVDDAKQCVKLGSSIGHFHVRDEQGKPTNDHQRYQQLFAELRTQSELDGLIICASTSGRHGQSLEERMAVLDLPLDTRPDMASLTLSSINFRDSASINSPKVIKSLAEKMARNNIKPELEIFDLGMIEFAHYLASEGLIKPPYYFNVIVGNIAGIKANFTHLAAIISNLPEHSVISFGGIGAQQMQANLFGISSADGIRIGLEDNLWMDSNRTKASNPDLVQRIVKIAKLSGRQIANITATRNLLAIS